MQKLINLLSKRPAAATNHPEQATHLQMLENRVRGAIRFLGKIKVKRGGGTSYRLNTLPWFLLIGSTNAGKTSLLAHSNINFILDKHARRENSANLVASSPCVWWGMRDAVLVDVPGSYLDTSGGRSTPSNSLLSHLLEIMQRVRGKEAIRGVIVAISLPELMDWDNHERLTTLIRKNIAEVRARFGQHLPIYFTLTKCDLLPGFMDFFNDCGSDELAQAWGITFPPVSATESFAEICQNRFDALIGRLNKQLIWRLHQERDAHARTYIKDFPLRIERVKEAFVDMLKNLTANGNHFALKGIYLTSAVQYPLAEQAPQTVSGNEFQRSMEIMNAPVLRRQAYFIKQFILQSILSSIPVPVKQDNWNRHAFASAAVLCMIAIGAIKGKDALEKFYPRTASVPIQSVSFVQAQLKPRLDVKAPVQVASNMAQSQKIQLARLKPGKFSNQHREDKV